MTRDLLRITAHRPFPIPRGPWIMFQSWRELLFAHWPIPRSVLRPLVPSELELDSFDGTCWLGQTPFRLARMRARLLPPIPRVSWFPEMNLRTYVRRGDVPGIFFFSLDAESWLAVQGARLAYRLPYFHAEMAIEHAGGWIRYRSRRKGAVDAEFRGRYRPTGAVVEPSAGSLEHFLTERYVLYSVTRGGGVLRGDIHHRPWPLRPAEAVIERNTVPSAHGIDLPSTTPLLHFSGRQDTVVWPPARAE